MAWNNVPAINEIDIAEKRLLLRLDLNAPIGEDGNVSDLTRLEAAVPTINYALARSCRIVLTSHLGRPKGQIKKEYSLEPVAKALANLLDHEILLSDYPVSDSANQLIRQMRTGDIVMLENLRFDPGETSNDSNFAKQLASYADIYINDAFGTAHRAHASTAGILEHLQGASGVGFLMEGADSPATVGRRSCQTFCGHARWSESLGQDHFGSSAHEAMPDDPGRWRDGLHFPSSSGY